MLREGILFFLSRPNGMEDGVPPLLNKVSEQRWVPKQCLNN